MSELIDAGIATDVTRTDHGNARFALFQRFWATMALVLFGVTGKLWWSPGELPQLPQIPVFEGLCSAPIQSDWMLLILIGSGLSIVALTRFGVVGLWTFAIAATFSVLLNQHRLQPWVDQFIVYAVVMASFPKRDALKWMSWIAISIYVYSAISKFDYQFVETLGRELSQTLAGLGGLDATKLPRGWVDSLTLVFPAFELFAAIGLVFYQSRRAGAVAIIGMHVVLLLILGPWGLRHHSGVLIWNLFLLGQAFFFWVFIRWEHKDAQPSQQRSVPIAERLALALVAFVLVYPLTVHVSICDHWLAWEVYAPRTSRAKLEISPSDIGKLPKALQPFLSVKAANDGFQVLDLNRWSLITIGAPIYPEDRFQFGVAVDVVRQCNLKSFRIAVAGESDRWTGKRAWQIVTRHDELDRLADDFRLNTHSRSAR